MSTKRSATKSRLEIPHSPSPSISSPHLPWETDEESADWVRHRRILKARGVKNPSVEDFVNLYREELGLE